MNQVLKDLSTPNLVTVLENNFFAYLMNYGSAPHRELYVGSDLIRFATGISFPFLNGVCRAQLQPDKIEDAIAKTLNYFIAKQLPMFWWTGPATQPPDLDKHLQTQGLTLTGELPVMAIDLSSVPEKQSLPTDLAIAQVEDPETLKHWVQVASIGFEVPETEVNSFFNLELSLGLDSKEYIRFIGLSNGVPVTTSALYLDEQVAGIYVVATLPEARGKGFATALVLATLQKASTLGYSIGTLQASKMGVNVYRRIGFQEYGKVGYYLWDGKSNPSEQ